MADYLFSCAFDEMCHITVLRIRAGTVTSVGVNLACLLSVLLEPYMPTTANIIWEQMNAPKAVTKSLTLKFTEMLPAGHKLNTVSNTDELVTIL